MYSYFAGFELGGFVSVALGTLTLGIPACVIFIIVSVIQKLIQKRPKTWLDKRINYGFIGIAVLCVLLQVAALLDLFFA